MSIGLNGKKVCLSAVILPSCLFLQECLLFRSTYYLISVLTSLTYGDTVIINIDLFCSWSSGVNIQCYELVLFKAFATLVHLNFSGDRIIDIIYK